MGALTPLGKVAGGKRKWLTNVTALTFAGSMTSAIVGALLGSLRGLLSPAPVGKFGILIAIAVAFIAMVRELGWLSFPLPQWARQTNGRWASFSSTLAAILWGFDLGLIFTTWLTFSGVWLLVVVTILVGEPIFGAALFVLYWLGRALSVWVAPLLMLDPSTTSELMEDLYKQHPLFRQIHLVGLVWSIGVLGLWLIS